MKKLATITALMFLIFTVQGQTKHDIDTYKVAFFSKDATGVFKELTGSVSADGLQNVKSLKFDLKIKVASINTGNGLQNKHAKSSEWFHASKFPMITFVSSKVFKNEKGVFAKGKLRIHGVSKEVTIPIKIQVKDTKVIYKAEFTVNRLNYGLGPKNKVSRNIKIIAGISVLK